MLCQQPPPASWSYFLRVNYAPVVASIASKFYHSCHLNEKELIMSKRLVLAAITLVVATASQDSRLVAGEIKGAVWNQSGGKILPANGADVSIVNSASGKVVAMTKANQFLYLGNWINHGYVVNVPPGKYSVSARWYNSSTKRWQTANCDRCVNSTNNGSAVVNLNTR
jgi:hypothetical protein